MTIDPIFNGEGGASVRAKLNELINTVNAGSQVVTVGDKPLYDEDKAYSPGDIVTYKNEESGSEIFQEFALYIALSSVPVGVSPENSLFDETENPDGVWKWQGQAIVQAAGQTAVIWVQDIDRLKELTDMRSGHGVLVDTENAIYVFDSESEAGIKPFAPGVGSWVKKYEFGENGGSTGGHVFEDSAGTVLPTRSVAKAGDGIEFEDDAVNERTVVRASDDIVSHVDGVDNQKHIAGQIYGTEGQEDKLLYIHPTTKKIIATDFTADQIVQVGNIDVSDIGVGERKIMLVEKDANEEPAFGGAVGLLDVIASPGLSDLLVETNPLWDDNQITLTGNNLQGQLGENSQFFQLNGDFFLCVSYNNGTTTSDGTATWIRNKGDDVLDPDNIANHAAIIAELEEESGWNAVAMFKITTAKSKRGMWWRAASGGYLYMCIDKNNGWTRVGSTPPTVPMEITPVSHPNLTTSLTNHDFSTGLYQENGTDEEAEQGQEWWDEMNGAVYKRNMNGKWAKIFG